ncbi:MAG: hypothetical protein GX759_03890 [Thermoanaerobacterales bacterium]|nr:hypothetical protein [Thermoanaerobacterales bacterium]
MKKSFTKRLLIAVGLAMGISTFVLSIINQIETDSAISLLSIGLICIAIERLEDK